MPWEKNGTPNTLAIAGDTLEITDLTATKTNQFISNIIVDSGLVSCAFTFNNNTNSVYTSRNSTNGGTDATAVNQTSSIATSATLDTAGEQGFNILYTVSVSGEEKLSMFLNLDTDSGTGAGFAPNRREAVFKFVPSPDADIISIECDNSQTGDMAINTNLSALGDIVAIPETIGGWVELGRTTLGSAGDTIDVSGLANKRYYMLLTSAIASGNMQLANCQLNGDSSSNYAWRISTNGGADSTATSTVGLITGTAQTTTPQLAVSYLANLASLEKLCMSHGVGQNTAGSSNAPVRRESVGKWAVTSSSINRINQTNDGTGSYDTGSELIVLGWDPSDVHTTNFWEELASVTLGSAASTITTGVVTPKKYNWVQIYCPGFTSGDHNLRLGNNSIDTGNNYAERRSKDGASDTTAVTQPGIRVHDSTGDDFFYINLFFINNASSEKLVTGHSNAAVPGAATVPHRFEFVGKWDNTSNQANILEVIANVGTMDADTTLKWWGSD